jgi:predicted nucleotidyltransferase
VRELGPLADSVVFVGGAIAPLLHTESPLPAPRATKDVDGVVASHRYADSERLHRALRKQGFRHVTAAGAHVHRWVAPSGELLDLLPVGDHSGGTGNTWDAAAIASAISVTIDGVTFRHAAAPAFIAMKLEAFKDRGEGDARASHDIEDVVALIASRPTIVTEVRAADPEVRARVREFALKLIESGVAEEIIAAHLNNADDRASAVRVTLHRIHGFAALA